MILSGPFRFLIKSLVYASVVILTTAAGGVCGASPGPVRSLEHFGTTVADFDGDNQPDLAISLAEGHFGYTLQLQLSTTHQCRYLRSRTVPPVAPSAFSFRLTARDVDGDHDLDIVLTAVLSDQQLAVWINDGRGGFSEGDLAAYPELIRNEELSLRAQTSRHPLQTLYGLSCRSFLGDVSSGGLLHRLFSGSFLRHLRQQFPAHCPLPDQHSSRAPPALILHS